MNSSIDQKRKGISRHWNQLDDLDFANDLALLSHTQLKMQEKTKTIVENSARLGLTIN
ncbi:hypothetical protein DPMN_010560 [Dreissena polymorpha]|uniref:Reverse transcriptase domain-containing protein n=1 Tax=Dreissena polymorpha TaxID=45954 RepID=A0A9D4N3D4_DREPO|nr:hypothetical protein DPMN_010560 [Dreissena polymorpha]